MAAGATLDADTDVDPGETPTLPGIQGPPTAPPQAQPAPAAGGQQPPAQPQGIAQPGGKGEIPTPTVTPEYDPKKLAKAQTTLDLLNAMKPKSRTDYMDWYEKTHGDIDQHYDNLQTQLGQRPGDDDEDLSKKEKFAKLLEFGLHLMKASAPASTNQGAALAGTLSDSADSYQQAVADKNAGAQKDYETQHAAIETQRTAALKGIGTPLDAMKAQDTRDKDAAAETKDTASAYKSISDANTTKASTLGAPTYAVAPNGVVHSLVRDEDGKTHAEPVTGIDGKPFAGRVLGHNTGSGVDTAGKDPAAVRTYKYATDVLGVDKNVAAPILGLKPSGDPAKDHAAVFRQIVSATMGDTDKATRAADQYVTNTYGAGAIPRQQARNSPVPLQPPPAAALQGLTAGKVRDFGIKGKWTVGIDGKPIPVNSPIAGQ